MSQEANNQEAGRLEIHGFSGRSTGKQTWRENIKLLREKADRYEALLNALPDTMSVEADEALWLMAHKILQHP